jgi:hypothetical protein
VAIENDNDTLRGKLDRRFGRAQLEPGCLGELVDLISTIGFSDDAGLRGDPIGKITNTSWTNSPWRRARRGASSSGHPPV